MQTQIDRIVNILIEKIKPILPPVLTDEAGEMIYDTYVAIAQQIRDSLKHVCEWRYDEAIGYQITSCDNEIDDQDTDARWKFCPCCGGTIKEVGK